MAKYNVGDKVTYLDMHKVVKSGTIEEVTQTEVYDWCKEPKALYLITNCPYLRYEEEIIGLYKEQMKNIILFKV